MGLHETPTFDLLADNSTTAKPVRRIVKGSVPQRAPESPQLCSPISDGKQKEDDLDKKAGRITAWSHSSRADSPVRREMVNDDAESTRIKRIESAKTHQLAKREKMRQERRLHPKSPSDALKANPFSRFISAFSVMAHPEHKRIHQGTAADEDDLMEPTEKRLRASESILDDEVDSSPEPAKTLDDLDSTMRPLSMNLSAIVATVAVAVVALLVGWTRRK